jgi:hypothetical protein
MRKYTPHIEIYVAEIEQLKLTTTSSKEVDAVAKTLIDKHHFKTFNDSHEV